jgi:hypothetical protein
MYAPGAGQTNYERGFSLYSAMSEEYGRPDFVMYTWAEAGWAAAPEGFGQYPSTMYVEPVEAVICRPYYRTDAIALSQWGSLGGTWEALTDKQGPGDTTIYQQVHAGTTVLTGLESAFYLPADPCFAVYLVRWGLDPDWPAGKEAYTEIDFGQYRLRIPFNRPAVLLDQATGTPLMEWGMRGGGSPGAESDAQRLSITVMCLRGKVLLSDDLGRSWQAYGLGDQEAQWLTVRSDVVRVRHVGSRWMFGLIPIDFPVAGVFDSRQYDKGYAPTAALEAGDWAGLGGEFYLRPDTNVTMVDVATAGPRWLRYRATLTPARHSAGGTTFGVSPELYTVRLQNKPTRALNVLWGAQTILLADLVELTIDQPDELENCYCTMLLDNTGAQGYQDLREYGVISLDLKAHDSATWYNAFAGYIYQVEPEIENLAGFVRVRFVGLWLRFEDVKANEGDPVFGGRTIGDAVEWAALRCGFGFDKAYWGGTEVCLPAGYPGRRAWQADAGRPWADFLKAVARCDGREIFFNADVLSYLPDPPEWPVSWNFKLSSDDSDGGPAGSIPVVGRIEVPRDPERHRNDVRVVGQDWDGNYLVSVMRDTGNILNDVGWEKSSVVMDPSYDTPQRVNAVARTIWSKVGRFPPRDVSFRVRGNPAIRRRDIFKVWGVGVKAHKSVFRVSGLRHAWDKEGPVFWTDITGRWLRTDA